MTTWVGIFKKGLQRASTEMYEVSSLALLKLNVEGQPLKSSKSTVLVESRLMAPPMYEVSSPAGMEIVTGVVIVPRIEQRSLAVRSPNAR